MLNYWRQISHGLVFAEILNGESVNKLGDLWEEPTCMYRFIITLAMNFECFSFTKNSIPAFVLFRVFFNIFLRDNNLYNILH